MEVLASRVLMRPPDLEASIRFYTAVVGLRVAREYGTEGRRTGAVLFCGGGFLELSTSPSAGPPEGLSLWLQVVDVDAEHERLDAAGVQVLAPPATMPWGLRECWVADPDGARLALVEVPERHPLRSRLS
ncbi:VOC family protein [soil metagenome]